MNTDGLLRFIDFHAKQGRTIEFFEDRDDSICVGIKKYFPDAGRCTTGFSWKTREEMLEVIGTDSFIQRVHEVMLASEEGMKEYMTNEG